MILHSVTDLSLITPFDVQKPLYLKVDGCVCECVRRENGYVVERLISTDLKDYLKLSPGVSVTAFERIEADGNKGKDKKQKECETY